MDRRSWLWRRKSSEKSPAETESSGSISSHSERFIDEQAYAINNPQSPEVTSKSVAIEEEDNDNVKILMEKLSAALMNISAKEDLVKQHAKVAEEAVSGWEKAEKEVVGLKQQLEAANKKNSGLENRVSHLDAALKECVRQLRQGREEQEQKIVEVLATKTLEWESMKSGFEGQLAELQEQLEIAKSSAASSAELDSDIRQRLETVEKENAYLKRDLLSRAEELELRILERDLSAQAAEQASKQHLESIKKVAKLEAECRRLKAIGRKGCCTNDHKSVTASSAYVESFTDSQSDIGERLLSVESDALRMESETFTSDHWTSAQATELDRNKNRMRVGRNAREPSLEINLMDDFLEMERLAALPDTESRDSYSEAGPGLEQSNSRESELKVEPDTMNLKIAELEEKINELESEKANTEMSLNDCQRQLEISESQLREAHTNLQELHSQVALVHESTEELHSQLALANESNQTKEEEIKTHKAEREVAQLQLRIAESEIKGLVSKVDSLDTLVKRESTAATESKTKCQELEEELLKLKREAELKQEAELQREANRNEELKIKQERELAIAASKFAECQKTISSLGRQLRSLATLEDIFLDPEKPFDRSSAATWCPTKV